MWISQFDQHLFAVDAEEGSEKYYPYLGSVRTQAGLLIVEAMMPGKTSGLRHHLVQ